jgi:hypothetical protein
MINVLILLEIGKALWTNDVVIKSEIVENSAIAKMLYLPLFKRPIIVILSSVQSVFEPYSPIGVSYLRFINPTIS